MLMGPMLKRILTSKLLLSMRMTAYRSLRRSKSDLSMSQVQQVFKTSAVYLWLGKVFCFTLLILIYSSWRFLGTFVMKVIVTDDDQVNTPHSMIHYSIVEQSSTVGMFYINPQTGEILVQQNTLDREVSQLTNLKFFFCGLIKLVTLSHCINFPTAVIFVSISYPFSFICINNVNIFYFPL